MSVEVSWTPIPVIEQNGYITGYTVQVMGTDSTLIRETLVDKDATSVEITDLTPFSLYHFSVCAKTKEGSGPLASTSSKTPEAGEFSTQCARIVNQVYHYIVN